MYLRLQRHTVERALSDYAQGTSQGRRQLGDGTIFMASGWPGKGHGALLRNVPLAECRYLQAFCTHLKTPVIFRAALAARRSGVRSPSAPPPRVGRHPSPVPHPQPHVGAGLKPAPTAKHAPHEPPKKRTATRLYLLGTLATMWTPSPGLLTTFRVPPCRDARSRIDLRPRWPGKSSCASKPVPSSETSSVIPRGSSSSFTFALAARACLTVLCRASCAMR